MLMVDDAIVLEAVGFCLAGQSLLHSIESELELL